MSETQKLLNALLCDIYGEQQRQAYCQSGPGSNTKSRVRCTHCGKLKKKPVQGSIAVMASGMAGNRSALATLAVDKLIDVCAILKMEILMMGYVLERVLLVRDRLRRHQEVLCDFVTAILLVESHDAQPKMRFSLSPPPPKAVFASVTSPTTHSNTNTSTGTGISNGNGRGSNNNHSSSAAGSRSLSRNNNNMLARQHGMDGGAAATEASDAADEAASDYIQWLHAMKLVARLPGGTPPEFRRKLWLSLADKYLKSKNVDWTQQREKCFCEEWREDDEELGIQIVKDLHRTGSNLCTGPAGSINQAKLKRILLGYARYNPEVGYCQGFNMLGALILQVMDKEEEESMKVMIYLVEGVLPTGYFCGSMGGLQADMGVFRELMQSKLPRLAKHLQRLQGPIENAYEPPLTNVFTMQWFLTIFCTTLPMSCVLRVWDLVLIEGSDVLLRTALVLWSLLEERVLNARTADDFYGKMGSFSSELLNGHLIDSNGLIEKIVQLGPIADIRQLRDKHLYNIAPLRHKQGLQLYYDDEDTHSDEESRLAVATVWGLNWGRRGSMGPSTASAGKQPVEHKDRLALDISLLKKQYDRLRERQKQAHVILTTACSTAARQTPPSNAPVNVPVNQLLLGRSAIVTNRGKRMGAPLGAIPPARKPSLPAVLQAKPAEKQLRRGETLLWRDTDPSKRRRDSLTWKEIKADRAALLREGGDSKPLKSQKLRSRMGKSDSSSYSEDSDGEQEASGGGSSTDTSLCDDDDPASAKSLEQSPKSKAKLARKLKEAPKKKPQLLEVREPSVERRRPKSWAPTTHEIPFMLMGVDSGDEKEPAATHTAKEEEDSATESGRFAFSRDLDWTQLSYTSAAGDLASSTFEPLHVETDILELPLGITSTSQLSPLPDIAAYLSTTTISPMPSPKPLYVDSINSLGSGDGVAVVNDDGVTNQYFERVNSVERPNKLELSYSLNEEDRMVDAELDERVGAPSSAAEPKELELVPAKVPQIRDDNIPGENKSDYKELLSMTIEPRKPPQPLSKASVKRRDPRRKTLTRSSTIELEERFQALERRLSQDVLSNRQCDEQERKHIPSTAALEERYNSLEKQLSAEKQSRDTKELDVECLEKPERIPSTADLETRFDALTKQMSSGGSDAKTPIELGGDEQASGDSSRSKEQNESEKTSKQHITQETKANPKETASGSEASDSKEAEAKKQGEQPRLKKLPSTAELEDRFNALERKLSTQKSSPAKTKKEPPDDEQSTKETKELRKDEEKPLKMSTKEGENPDKESQKQEQQPESKKNDVKSIEDNAKENRETTEAGVKEKPQQESKAPLKKDETKRVEQSEAADPAKRKEPPSTAELEKRFQALEKQMSTTSFESSAEAKIKETKPLAQEEPAAKKSEENTTEENLPKSTKCFEDKCKAINTALANEQENEVNPNKFEEKCKAINAKIDSDKKIDEGSKEQQSEATKSEKPSVLAQDGLPKDLTKRRASEPPSTEDLEKRYETLKRRMSTRNHDSGHGESVNEALQRIEQDVITEMGETGAEDEEQQQQEKKQPPTTADLESRYEALHSHEATQTASSTQPRSPPRHVDVAIEAHIPEPPPPPPAHLFHRNDDNKADPKRHQQRALIEELQSKMQRQSPGEENLKPSDINPQRKRQQQQRQLQQRPTPMGDETSEAPANTAYYRSGNYEPWQAQKMVRRFSDLPSRADLENRLQFLEKQLYKKFYKQRCASDSEVASRASKADADANADHDHRPSTSRQAEAKLEQRVLALEKQLSENSLKLLEAMQEKAAATHSNDENGSPPETIDATGKELVRYTHFGEVEETDAHKPINISINIKMLVSKDGEAKKRTTPEHRPTTEELTKRLEQLEQELVDERARNATAIPAEEEAVEELEQPIMLEDNEASKKEEKDSHNECVKSDVPEKDQSLHAEPETVKETKTLENEEKAQTRTKDSTVVGKEKAIEDHESNQVSTIEEPKEATNATAEATEVELEKPEEQLPANEPAQDMVINASDIGPVDGNNKTVVLLMDNEPKAVKVRRLTRANTEELEGLFQALEKQLSERNLVKSENGKLVRADSKPTSEQIEQAQAISDLTKEIEDFTSGKPEQKPTAEIQSEAKPAEELDYDWGPNPVKHHLKRKTVYLPSTKELEARFRSLERQIKLLEDVEKIDVEQRLVEIERKIKLQYSLSHEKDLNKYLDLCEGKGLDDEEPLDEETQPETQERSRSPARKATAKSPYTSPSRKTATKTPSRSPYTSPSRKTATKSPSRSPYTSPPPSRQHQKTPHTSPTHVVDKKKSPYTSPGHRHPDDLPISDDLEYKYRVLDLVRSKSKENLAKRKQDPSKKPPIHPLEMLLDPSPDDSEIPTTGELEHRIRLLDEKLKSPVAGTCRKSRSRSPTIEDIKRKKMLEQQRPKTPVHNLERMVYSPSKPEPPTAAELDERMRALEDEKSFDFKTQKDYREFNQKLKDVVSPSLSFEEFKAAKSREQSPRRGGGAATTPKSALRRDESDWETPHYQRPTSPKVIRFRDEDEEYYEDTRRTTTSRQASERMTLADHSTGTRSYSSATATSSEGVDEFGSRMMRETSPITRTGTHTGVPLRTGDNINERLSSIKNTIKSIDSLCEEKPYQKEKCQRYIDSLFSDSLHFSSKKNSAEDLTHSRSESRGRSAQHGSGADYTPAIRITSAHGQRSLGSAESIRATSPLRAASPLHHRSHRDISRSRELSPRRRREAEEREERESSRVRRDMLPNYLLDNPSDLSSNSSLTKFHKVDRQLEETYNKYADDRRSASRSPLSSPYESGRAGLGHGHSDTTTATRYTSHNSYNNTTTATGDSGPRPRLDIDRPVSPYRPPYDPYKTTRSNTPVYQPAKLEIRHTTVTSTFYDRFLTEKQIEKETLSRPPSRSPIVSPSVTSKSYTDLPQAAAGLSTYKYEDEALDALPVAVPSTSSYSGMSSSYTGTSLPSHTSYPYFTASTASAVPASSTAQLSVSSGSAADLHMRSCDNILMQLGTTTATLTTTPALHYTSSSLTPTSSTYASTIATTSSAYVPYTFTPSSLSSRLVGTSSSTDALSYSTGVYNPMMSFTLRQPLTSSVLGSSSSGLLGQYKGSLGSSYGATAAGEQAKP